MFHFTKVLSAVSFRTLFRYGYPTSAFPVKGDVNLMLNMNGNHKEIDTDTSKTIFTDILKRIINQSLRVWTHICIKVLPLEHDENRLACQIELGKQVVHVTMDEGIDEQLIYDFFNRLNGHSINSDSEENSLQFQISHVADYLRLKLLWFDTTSALLYGNNYQADFGSDQMLYHLRDNMDRTQWCVKKEMTIQYLTKSRTPTVQTRLRHDLLIFNLRCQDASDALTSSTGYIYRANKLRVTTVIEYLSTSNMSKDLQVLPPILANNGIPAYYVVDLRKNVLYEYLLDSITQSYPSKPKKISIDDIKQEPLVLKPINIQIPFNVIYHPPPSSRY